MIRYDLVCTNRHRFDAWFRNSGEFERQAATGLLDCPICADTKISKALMTPGVQTARGKARSEPSPGPSHATEASGRPVPIAPKPAPDMAPEAVRAAMRVAALRQMMVAMHRHVTETAENVGKGFAREARLIHDGEAEERGIYGEATREEVEDLLEDGITVMPLPAPPESDA